MLRRSYKYDLKELINMRTLYDCGINDYVGSKFGKLGTNDAINPIIDKVYKAE